MKRYLVGAFSALLLTAASPATAQDRAILGGGNAACRALIEADAFRFDHANMQWLLGYVSAATNFGITLQGGETQLSRRVDQLGNGGIIQWATLWCNRNRSKTLDEAASRFVASSGAAI